MIRRPALHLAAISSLFALVGCSNYIEVDVSIELADDIEIRDAQIVVDVSCGDYGGELIVLPAADDIREYQAFAGCSEFSDATVQIQVFVDHDRNAVRSEDEPFTERSVEAKGDYAASTLRLDSV